MEVFTNTIIPGPGLTEVPPTLMAVIVTWENSDLMIAPAPAPHHNNLFKLGTNVKISLATDPLDTSTTPNS